MTVVLYTVPKMAMPRPRRQVAALVLAAALLIPPLLEAQAESTAPTTFLGFSYGRYQVADAVFKEVYGEGGSILGLTVSQRLFGARNFDLSAVIDLRRFGRTGASTISLVETTFRMTPATLGLEASLQQGIAVLWLGAGLGLTFYSEESALQDTSGSTLGFTVAGGLALQPSRTVPLRLKLILRWTKAGTTENEIPVELGGPEYGFALVYGFRLF